MPEFELYVARVPMARAFRHFTKSRTASSSVLIVVREGDVEGWGESAPRPYVTGETVGSVLAALARPEVLRPAAEALLLPLDDALDAVAGLPAPPGPGGADVAALAAAAGLETALLDHLCRREGITGFEALHRAGFGDVLAATPAPAPVATVIDLERDPITYLESLPEQWRMAIPHVKLKAGSDLRATASLAARVRDLLPVTATVSVDANGAWDPAAVLRHADALRESGLTWLEEPLAARRWGDLAALRGSGLTVMLDESCASAHDLAACLAHEAADMVNLRVSKCGGPLRLLAMLRTARRAGLGVQIGVQVGEVGPLWATGRLVATAVPDLAAVEAGRQDEWFPPDLTTPTYAVDRAGSLAPVLNGPGIGVRVTSALLERCTPHPIGSIDRPAGTTSRGPA
ncbi:enolase C-terminal domain-like protein [Micromonospora sp. KLBMP9576]|uniref:enolase C-terminal domain-like protein n=1 Tax=Micromonospora sp. KLBMP9576 TaxID=3424769 RepID=UPI003D9257AE